MNFIEKQEIEIWKYLNRLDYDLEDNVAIVLINHKEGKIYQHIWRVNEILEKIKYLRKMNAKGYSVYMSINVLKEGASSRKKEDFKEKQKRLYLDLDAKDRKAKDMVLELAKYLLIRDLPQPTHITKTSKGNYQVYWILDEEIEWKILEVIMEKINTDLELDHTQDVSRVFRLPYFRNKKPSKDDLVVNIDELDGLIKLKATGEKVNVKNFLKVFEIDIDLKEQRRKTDKEIKVLNQELSRYVKQAEEIINKYIEDKLLDKNVLNLFSRAVERNNNKSPSEIELSFITRLYLARYKEEIIRKLLKELAGLRNKNELYVELTLRKAKSFNFNRKQGLRRMS